LINAKVMSPQTATMEMGYDPETELANIKEFEQSMPQQQGLPGLPGADGAAPDPKRSQAAKMAAQARGQTGESVSESKDSSGHEHKGKGEGGGQFTSGGGADPVSHAASTFQHAFDHATTVEHGRKLLEPLKTLSKASLQKVAEKLGYQFRGMSKEAMFNRLQSFVDGIVVSKSRADLIGKDKLPEPELPEAAKQGYDAVGVKASATAAELQALPWEDRRHIAANLASAYEDADSDAERQLIIKHMGKMGMTQHGSPGDAVAFDGSTMKTEANLLPGDAAKVVQPGFSVDSPEGYVSMPVTATVEKLTDAQAKPETKLRATRLGQRKTPD
jgi:hypothetical protein